MTDDLKQKEALEPAETPEATEITGTNETPEVPEMSEEAAPAETAAKERLQPELEDLENELSREKYRSRYHRTIRTTIYALVIVAAAAILITTFWMPVLQIYGNSMNDTLVSGDIVVCRKAGNIDQGDVLAFYLNNKILVKRCVAVGGDRVDLDEEGNLTVNGVPLEEPYVKDQQRGDVSTIFPYVVPEGQYFVMSDNRANSGDSRNAAIGCVTQDRLLAKPVLRVWPLNHFRFIK